MKVAPMQAGVLQAGSNSAPEHPARYQSRWVAGSMVGDGYRLESLISVGSITDVWRAQTQSGSKLAIKTLKSDVVGRPDAAAVIRHEYAVLAKLQHPNIVALDGLIDNKADVALVLRYLDGGDLVSLAGFHPRHWIGATCDLAVALAFMHERRFVHRDIKARNVLFDSQDTASLIDFGSAARIDTIRTASGMTAAHRRNWLLDHPANVEDDMFAFAVLLYELMSGRLPHGPAPSSSTQAREPGLPLGGEPPGDTELAALQDLVLLALSPSADDSILSLSRFLNVIKSLHRRYASES